MDRKDIVICEKPQSVTWDSVHDLLWESHADNRAKGINMRYPSLPGSEIRKRVENNGKMFVALDGEKVVGTAAVILKKKGYWCGGLEDIYGYKCFIGLLPEYQGHGIFGKMDMFVEDYVARKKVDKICFDTNTKNRNIIRQSLKHGYRKIDCEFYGDHKNVVMVKWLNCKPPYSKLSTWLYYRYLSLRKTLQHYFRK